MYCSRRNNIIRVYTIYKNHKTNKNIIAAAAVSSRTPDAIRKNLKRFVYFNTNSNPIFIVNGRVHVCARACMCYANKRGGTLTYTQRNNNTEEEEVEKKEKKLYTTIVVSCVLALAD